MVILFQELKISKICKKFKFHDSFLRADQKRAKKALLDELDFLDPDIVHTTDHWIQDSIKKLSFGELGLQKEKKSNFFFMFSWSKNYLFIIHIMASALESYKA